MAAFMTSAFPWLSMGLFVAVAASLCTEKVRNSGNPTNKNGDGKPRA